jgi:hypothetical protein
VSRRTWTASDYLLRNEFCPPSQIQWHLDNVRSDAGASLLVMIACDRDSVIKNLVFISGTSGDNHDDIRAVIETVAARLDGRFRNIKPGLLIKAIEDQPGWLHRPPHLFAAALPNYRISAESIGYWLISDVKSAVDAARTKKSPPFADMLNGTAIANVQRDARITRLVQNVAPPQMHNSSSSISYEGLRNLLDLAAEVVSASDVASYALDRSGIRLRLEQMSTGTHMDLPKRVELKKPKRVELKKHSTDLVADYIRKAYLESTTRIYHTPDISTHSLGQVPAEVTTKEKVSNEEEILVCIVVPFAPLGKDMPNSGVLAVRRRGRHAEQFTMFELALLRNVALRLALLSSLLRQQSLSAHLASFGDNLSRSSRLVVSRNIRKNVAPGIPWDIQLARDLLEDLVHEARKVTQSASATFRVLINTGAPLNPLLSIGDASWGTTTVLRRFIYDSEDGLDDQYRDIAVFGVDENGMLMSSISVNANAVVYGRMAHIWSVEHDLSTQCTGLSRVVQVNGRPAIGSELCFPVSADGHVLGTLNFESPQRGAYLGEIETIRAYAALAGAAISATRSNILAEMSERSAQMQIGYHEARNLTKLINELRQVTPPGKRSLVEKVEALILRTLKKQPDPLSLVSSDGVSLRKILDEELHSLGFPTSHVRVPKSLLVPEESAHSIGLCLRELLKNQLTHSNVERGARRVLEAESTYCGGREEIVLVATNAPKILPTTEFLSQVYNYPIYANNLGWASLGCYTIGRLVRQMSGDVQMALTGDELLETRMVLPAWTGGKR